MRFRFVGFYLNGWIPVCLRGCYSVYIAVSRFHIKSFTSPRSLSPSSVYRAVNYTYWLARLSDTLEIKSLTWMCHSVSILTPKDTVNTTESLEWHTALEWVQIWLPLILIISLFCRHLSMNVRIITTQSIQWFEHVPDNTSAQLK